MNCHNSGDGLGFCSEPCAQAVFGDPPMGRDLDNPVEIDNNEGYEVCEFCGKRLS